MLTLSQHCLFMLDKDVGSRRHFPSIAKSRIRPHRWFSYNRTTEEDLGELPKVPRYQDFANDYWDRGGWVSTHSITLNVAYDIIQFEFDSSELRLYP